MKLAQFGLKIFALITWFFTSHLGFAEEIDDELRLMLTQTINDSSSFQDRFDAEVWLVQKNAVLAKFIKDPKRRLYLLKEIHKAATRAELPPNFVLALIEVESAFKPYALSSAGARGLMQIMPFWKKELGRDDDNLMDIETNLKYGCTILKYYLKRADNDWSEALARYNGSYGRLRYPIKVMDAWDAHWR
ncbi:MAG: soluble lytic murein transglycosylase-like protein [Flavobacteriales bacterium]|jgi:soluble lytic murein transglycosylase-like protein